MLMRSSESAALEKLIHTISSSSLLSSWSSRSLASSCSCCLRSCFSFRSLSHFCASVSSSAPLVGSPGVWAASGSQSNAYEWTQWWICSSDIPGITGLFCLGWSFTAVWPSVIGHLKLCMKSMATKGSPVWPSKSKGSSGGSGEWGTVGRTGASSLRETAVSRRSSGM